MWTALSNLFSVLYNSGIQINIKFSSCFIHPVLNCVKVIHMLQRPSPKSILKMLLFSVGPDCELVVSPLTHCPIRGEVNLLRYLNRSLTAPQDPVSEVQLDSLLDVCHRLGHAHTVRDKQLAVRTLNTRLGQAPWLLGEVLSLADVAAWSALRAISGVELSQNMSKWQSRSEYAFGVGKRINQSFMLVRLIVECYYSRTPFNQVLKLKN